MLGRIVICGHFRWLFVAFINALHRDLGRHAVLAGKPFAAGHGWLEAHGWWVDVLLEYFRFPRYNERDGFDEGIVYSLVCAHHLGLMNVDATFWHECNATLRL